jgi:GTPase SAR1 family protein
VKEQADPDITIMLVGNKLDKAESNGREVSEEEGRKFAEQQKILFKETSAMDSTNVDNAFEDLLEKIDVNRQKLQKSDK